MGLNGTRAATDWRAVGRGGAAGLLVIVPLSIYQGTLSDPCDAPAWVFFGLLAAFFAAGFVAATAKRDSAFQHGSLGALAALAGWIVVRLIRNAVASGATQHCGSGLLAIVTTGVLAIAFGSLGGFAGARRSREGDA